MAHQCLNEASLKRTSSTRADEPPPSDSHASTAISAPRAAEGKAKGGRSGALLRARRAREAQAAAAAASAAAVQTAKAEMETEGYLEQLEAYAEVLEVEAEEERARQQRAANAEADESKEAKKNTARSGAIERAVGFRIRFRCPQAGRPIVASSFFAIHVDKFGASIRILLGPVTPNHFFVRFWVVPGTDG